MAISHIANHCCFYALDILPLEAGAFFVTRATSNFNARRIHSATVDKITGVVCDQSVALNGHCVARDCPEHLRRVRFKDPATGRTWIFLTNITALPAPAVAQSSKNRWQAEVFFEWIRRQPRIKRCLGSSESAMKMQGWCAIATCVFTAIVKKELQLKPLLCTWLQILSVSVFEKTLPSCALFTDDCKTQRPADVNQLILLEF